MGEKSNLEEQLGLGSMGGFGHVFFRTRDIFPLWWTIGFIHGMRCIEIETIRVQCVFRSADNCCFVCE